MATITQGNTATFTLASGEQVYIQTDGLAAIKYGRDIEKAPSVVSLSSGTMGNRYGPYEVPMNFSITATTSAAYYSTEDVLSDAVNPIAAGFRYMKVLTQAEYDALSPAADDVYYIIVG